MTVGRSGKQAEAPAAAGGVGAAQPAQEWAATRGESEEQ